jgi:hypothetical protein
VATDIGAKVTLSARAVDVWRGVMFLLSALHLTAARFLDKSENPFRSKKKHRSLAM